MKRSPEAVGRDADLLARSIFTLLFVGALITLLSEVVLVRTALLQALYWRWTLLCGALLVLTLAAMGLVLRAPLSRIHALARIFTGWFGRPAVALPLGGVILLATAAVIPLFNNSLPSQPVVVPLLLTGWGMLLLVGLALCNATRISGLFARTRRLWVGIGAGCAFLVLFAILLVVADAVTRRINLGGLASDSSAIYRNLPFYGNELHPDWERTLWNEGNIPAAWLPYVYSRAQPFHGQFTNVDNNGLRATVSPVPDADTAPEVYFFGASTMWGVGSRDAYTIPSQIARLLAQDDRPIRAVNFGQRGSVTTQDLILFQRQLALGRVPAVAVFYGAYNDLTSVFINEDNTGLPLNEINRARDFVSGQILRSRGRPLLHQPDLQMGDYDFSLVSSPDASPAEALDLYLQNVRQVRALAHEYGVRVLFVWQPDVSYKQTLAPHEERFSLSLEQTYPTFAGFYQQVDQALRRRVQDQGLTDILILSDLFANDPAYRFIDQVHVTEDANAIIAQAILPALRSLLDSQPSPAS